MYTVRGFAYHGAGLAVQRVEISLDGGQTWKGCFRQFVDEPLHHGTKHWAWIFWSCDVQYSELLNGKEIVVRAWDACKNVQPERISWNILGMMNNSWYHVKLAFEGKPLALTAKHPVAPGAKAGGWMVPPAEDKGSGCKASDDKTFTLDEVAKHASDDDCWIILDETVYKLKSAIDGIAGEVYKDHTTKHRVKFANILFRKSVSDDILAASRARSRGLARGALEGVKTPESVLGYWSSRAEMVYGKVSVTTKDAARNKTTSAVSRIPRS
ncbi:hypothetical protein AURDEDRAFT_168826 [Auricularia subglabra TFB-10046 SS5]|nr:hypothetical protein AURDEDRAFT_168826 [Auricularia subglabra TFB-10046 SS5]